MTDLALIPATEADAGTVTRFITELWTAHGNPPTDAAVVGERARMMIERYDAYLIVEAGETVGYTALLDNGDHVFIRHFVIAEGARGRGLGRRAVALLLDGPLAGRLVKLEASMKIAQPRAFWESVGFEVRSWMMGRNPETA